MSTEQPSPDHSSAGQKDVIADHFDLIRQIEIEGYELGVKKARNGLLWAGSLIIFWELWGAYRAFGTIETSVIVFVITVGSIFAALALWTRKKPYTAVISGIAAFILYKLSVVLINSGSGVSIAKALFGGIIVTILVLVSLFRALPDAKQLQQAKQEQ